MIYEKLKCIKIFLASAGDVREERDSLEKILQQENELHYKNQGYLFDFVRWEKSSPLDNKPWQKSLNELIDNCAIFVILLWAKLGEGTKEEFEYAISKQRGKGLPHIIIFYNVDPPEEVNSSDIEEVNGFMEELRKNYPEVRVFKYRERSTVQDYENLDFIFKKNISNWFYSIKKEEKLESLSKTPEESPISSQEFRSLNKGF